MRTTKKAALVVACVTGMAAAVNAPAQADPLPPPSVPSAPALPDVAP
ncbi:hypothetical protein [Actinocorallia sp. A-T 12471]|nr:hypothetical protein [Actinocorallia sp. A-T 12471]MDX6741323.1 hypothetical protein [Actinocorallia sp. A-T 12471]